MRLRINCLGLRRFVTELFYDHDGKPSFSRVGSALVLIGCVFWITFAMFVFRHIPDNAQGILIGTAAIVTSLYSANAVSNSINGTGTTTDK